MDFEGAGVQGRQQLRLGREGLELDRLRLDVPEVALGRVSLVGVGDRGRVPEDVLREELRAEEGYWD